MFFMAIGYWSASKTVFYRLLVLVAISALVNAYAKDWFQDPRPPMELRLDDLVEKSYGLPSGHAQLAVVMWMWLAWEIRALWAWVLCGLIALGVMASRMYLGVHDLEDVTVGAAIGAVTLVIFESLRHRNLRWQLHFTTSALLIAVVTGLALKTWPGTAPDYVPMLAGWLAAATWALHVDDAQLDYAPPSELPKKVLVGVIGAAAFIAEQKLLKVLGAGNTMDPMQWNLMKGLISGIFVSLLMPALFVRFGLAGRAHPMPHAH
ncbi:phosphatase PAP2 family protein [Curvibacter sp. APW13]|uniref:phosphatase PAP2 family protein n=1 Tax=Curvibacter sp. APW13 TaxID=3077236 RepID=UPI0028DF510B|nr:phosphatase PAP2 family protein [Curvibacter sp. APW13]MDT8991793.1 phosphatase PAP2 family protein [Curvibacter sp. APW13]